MAGYGSLEKVAVCSRSFSRNEVLRGELKERYSNVKFNDSGASLAGDSLVSFLDGASHAIVALENITSDVLCRLPQLKRISKYGVGLNNVDLGSLQQYGVELGWTGGVNARSVAELVVCAAIAKRRKLREAIRAFESNQWRQVTGSLLSECTFGLIGCGYVGREVVKLLQPFGCQIVYFDIERKFELEREFSITYRKLDDVLAISDVLSIHVPLDDSTSMMIGRSEMGTMKSSAIIINTSRGGIVDEKELFMRLKSRSLGGAWFDVFEEEPFFDPSLVSLSSFTGTPHIGGSSDEAILAMGRAAIIGLGCEPYLSDRANTATER